METEASPMVAMWTFASRAVRTAAMASHAISIEEKRSMM